MPAHKISLPLKIQSIYRRYPAQFWILVTGSLLSSIGASMVWPFLTNHLHRDLGVPQLTITYMMALNSMMAIAASFISGPIADRLGRKPVMLLSLFGGTAYFYLMGQVEVVLLVAILWALWGALNPMYAVGANAMVSDLITDDRRIEAYAILRVIHNVGIAIGPVLGGLLATLFSFSASFIAASIALTVYGVITLIWVKETLPSKNQVSPTVALSPIQADRTGMQGLLKVLRDSLFMSVFLSFTVTTMAASIMFSLLLVYANSQFGITEGQYSWVITTNALMCIFVQFGVTRLTIRFKPLPVLAVGALFYAMGVGSVALGRELWSFILSMVIMTIGELIMTPTATTLVANLAPVDLRGRYMGIYSLMWPIGNGLGPMLGSAIARVTFPAALWLAGGSFALLSALWFAYMALRFRYLPASGVQRDSSLTAQV